MINTEIAARAASGLVTQAEPNVLNTSFSASQAAGTSEASASSETKPRPTLQLISVAVEASIPPKENVTYNKACQTLALATDQPQGKVFRTYDRICRK